jgi:hypothetical protein
MVVVELAYDFWTMTFASCSRSCEREGTRVQQDKQINNSLDVHCLTDLDNK